MLKWIKSGSPWIWLTGGAVSVSLLSVLGLLLLIGWQGLAYFWPAPLYKWEVNSQQTLAQVSQQNTLVSESKLSSLAAESSSVHTVLPTKTPSFLIGQLYERDDIASSHILNLQHKLPNMSHLPDTIERLSIKIANRGLYPVEFISVLAPQLSKPTKPKDWAVISRSRGGDFFGKPIAFRLHDHRFTHNITDKVSESLVLSNAIRDQINQITKQQVKGLSWQLETLRLQKRKLELNGQLDEAFVQTYQRQTAYLTEQLKGLEVKLDQLREQLHSDALLVKDMTGKITEIPLEQLLDVWYPNDMSVGEKLVHWAKQVWIFVSDSPRESNTEGGIFPAIFGTVLLVLIMAIVVMPLGVIAAIYLHEYAKNTAFTRMLRIAVINLAGVPSIVYGVFGLGFFVYTVGGSIDKLFYAERLPAPTFGTPGLLWSALTLAVLTLPVVIVTTEEGLSRIPSSVRHGSFALGATHFETIWRIILPMASPAIITGLILAVARAAGEVAPLMLVGAVKLASSLPVDGQFPYVHLERKFMHLGFQIYDVGFQTSNIEAARPLVYATSFLLVAVIVGLNLTAIRIRNNLREKYRTLGQD